MVESILDMGTLRRILNDIATTRPDEIGCEDCFEALDRFAEMVLLGKDAAEAMPLVKDHLNRCGNCRQEFEALLAALQGMSGQRTG